MIRIAITPVAYAAIAATLTLAALPARHRFAETFPGAPLNGLVDLHTATNWAAAKG